MSVEQDFKRAAQEFVEMTINERERAMKRAYTNVAKMVVEASRSALRSAYKNVDVKNPKYSDTLASGIRKTKPNIDRENNLYIKIRAHKMNKPSSGAYRLPMLDGGTADRYVKSRNGEPLKKPAYRGRIQGFPFYKSTIDRMLPMVEQYIYAELNKVIDAINKKSK